MPADLSKYSAVLFPGLHVCIVSETVAVPLHILASNDVQLATPPFPLNRRHLVCPVQRKRIMQVTQIFLCLHSYLYRSPSIYCVCPVFGMSSARRQI